MLVCECLSAHAEVSTTDDEQQERLDLQMDDFTEFQREHTRGHGRDLALLRWSEVGYGGDYSEFMFFDY